MPVKASYAAKLINKYFALWIKETSPVKSLLPYVLATWLLKTYSIVSPQTTTVSDANVGFIDEDSSTAVGSSVIDPDITNEFNLVRLVGDVEVNSNVLAYTRQPLFLEFMALLQAFLYKLAAAVIKDDGTNGTMKGIDAFIDTGTNANNIAMSGGSLTAAVIAQLVFEKFRDGWPDYLMTHSRGMIKVDELIRASNYSPNMVCVPQLRMTAPALMGIPVIFDDHINLSAGTPDTTHLYAFKTGWGRGICLAHSAPGGRAIQIKRITKPEDDQERYRLAMDCALVVPTPAVVARVSDFAV